MPYVSVSICSKHIPSTLDVNRSVSMHIWLLWDVFFIFIGAFGSEFGAPICDRLWEQRDFLFFHDFDDVVVFYRAGMADKSCSEHIAGTMGAH